MGGVVGGCWLPIAQYSPSKTGLPVRGEEEWKEESPALGGLTGEGDIGGGDG